MATTPAGTHRVDMAVAPLIQGLRAASTVGRRVAARQGRPVLVWTSAAVPAVDPIALFERAAGFGAARLLWARPADGESLVGIGAAWEATAEGPARLGAVGDAWRRCLAEAVGVGDGAGPAAMGGFAFAPTVDPRSPWRTFPAGWLLVPWLVVRTTGAGSQAVLSTLVPPDGDGTSPYNDGSSLHDATHLAALLDPQDGPGRPQPVQPASYRVQNTVTTAPPVAEIPATSRWKALVVEAAAAVRGGALRKVVLARAVTVDGVTTGLATALHRLRTAYPGCALFAVARGDLCFLGATPERLLRVRNGVVSTGALAGSAPRGTAPEEDEYLGQVLLASSKDRLEHALVVEAVRDAMTAACDDVVAPPTPVLLRMPNVQHLYTPLRGRLRAPLEILELASRLHPTPAVGGVPQEAALKWIARHE
ncbi:MAG: chorismate-binding protein, partial [Armatimonadota bacterium]|nr:chorismate-binding protein [Armatimonadota bacterium]